jgi:methyl-accepting chemotaxis protein
MKESMDAATIARDNNCELGKWLHGEARALYRNCPGHTKCVTDHAAFHVEAGKVAAAVNAKRKDDVERMLSAGSAFSEASKRVAVSIIELKNQIAA